jgi:hypothetical protein
MKFTPTERESAIRAIVLSQGNVRRAQAALASSGLNVSERQLRDWKAGERYEELEANREWINEDLAITSEQIATLAGEATVKLLNSINEMDEDELRKLSPNVRAMALQKTGLAMATATDKALLLRGRPTSIREDKSLVELMEYLDKRFGKVIQFAPELKAIDSTAKDITPES